MLRSVGAQFARACFRSPKFLTVLSALWAAVLPGVLAAGLGLIHTRPAHSMQVCDGLTLNQTTPPRPPGGAGANNQDINFGDFTFEPGDRLVFNFQTAGQGGGVIRIDQILIGSQGFLGVSINLVDGVVENLEIVNTGSAPANGDLEVEISNAVVGATVTVSINCVPVGGAGGNAGAGGGLNGNAVRDQVTGTFSVTNPETVDGSVFDVFGVSFSKALFEQAIEAQRVVDAIIDPLAEFGEGARGDEGQADEQQNPQQPADNAAVLVNPEPQRGGRAEAGANPDNQVPEANLPQRRVLGVNRDEEQQTSDDKENDNDNEEESEETAKGGADPCAECRFELAGLQVRRGELLQAIEDAEIEISVLNQRIGEVLNNAFFNSESPFSEPLTRFDGNIATDPAAIERLVTQTIEQVEQTAVVEFDVANDFVGVQTTKGVFEGFALTREEASSLVRASLDRSDPSFDQDVRQKEDEIRRRRLEDRNPNLGDTEERVNFAEFDLELAQGQLEFREERIADAREAIANAEKEVKRITDSAGLSNEGAKELIENAINNDFSTLLSDLARGDQTTDAKKEAFDELLSLSGQLGGAGDTIRQADEVRARLNQEIQEAETAVAAARQEQREAERKAAQDLSENPILVSSEDSIREAALERLQDLLRDFLVKKEGELLDAKIRINESDLKRLEIDIAEKEAKLLLCITQNRQSSLELDPFNSGFGLPEQTSIASVERLVSGRAASFPSSQLAFVPATAFTEVTFSRVTDGDGRDVSAAADSFAVSAQEPGRVTVRNGITAISKSTLKGRFDLRSWRSNQDRQSAQTANAGGQPGAGEGDPLIELPGFLADERFNLFASTTVSLGENDEADQDSVSFAISGGISWLAHPRLNVGLAGRYQQAEIDGSVSDIDADTWGISVFAQSRLPLGEQAINLEGIVAYSRSDLDSVFNNVGVVTTADSTTEAFSTQVKASESFSIESFSITPFVSATYIQTEQEAFILSDEQFAPGASNDQVTLSSGASLSTSFELPESDITLSPSLGVGAFGTVTDGGNLGVSANGGLGFKSRSGISGGFGVGFSGLTGDSQNLSISGNISIPLY